MAKCKDCRGTGKITLLRSVVDCDCVRKTSPSYGDGPQDFPKGSNKRNGWYSKKQRGMIKRIIRSPLADKTGTVETTEIGRSAKPSGEWDDYTFVGIVEILT